MDVLSEIAGWTGAAVMLTAYLSVSMGWVRTGRRFQVGNLLGSFAFIINGAYHGAWPSVVTNIVWFLISVTGLLRILRKGNAAEPAISIGSLQTASAQGQITSVSQNPGGCQTEFTGHQSGACLPGAERYREPASACDMGPSVVPANAHA
ncbi:hypothetical protein SRABI83_04160 [Arthrobacter sp. Bi83]|jgi:hypothetical protein|uniref:CBU_0592 family membrane protein n=1 Tax=Arthrobacter sp. Bi83 TaxID=2822353 RepID=UPI001DCC2707|nr:hypothetical protein [Arthrobacter sp. Bi83]CAH0289335.1 hypothetical protein SRABI83_04160 [Arthrobacter sp. Bi83]